MLRRHVLGAAAAVAGTAALGRRASAAGLVKIVYVEWADTIVATNILSETLKQAGWRVVHIGPCSGKRQSLSGCVA